jgi:hypothetical protein
LGKPGDWKIIMNEVPPLLPPLSANAPSVTKRAVLAQLARDPADEHFPLLIFEAETFTDFTFTTRFKAVAGAVEQMAGIAFRFQDEKNYYVVRASSLGHNLRFYKFVNGARSTPIGPEVAVPSGVWHELTVECKGNQIRCLLNGRETIPPLTDYTFTFGKVGFWTKSDSESYFADAKIVYTPREPFAQVLLRATLQAHPHLHGLKIYLPKPDKSGTTLVASNDPKEVGQAGEKAELDVATRGVIYTAKGRETYDVIIPLHDRNGETVAAVRVVLKSFYGQTEQNAIARALPIVKTMDSRVKEAKDLTE